MLSTAATVGAGRTSTDSLIEHVSDQIVDVLHLDACRFDPDEGPAPATLEGDGTVVYNGHPVDVERHGLPVDAEIALPVRSGGVVRGRFLLPASTRVVRPSLEQLRVAGAPANQVGAALTASAR